MPRMQGCFGCHQMSGAAQGEAKSTCDTCHLSSTDGRMKTMFALGELTYGGDEFVNDLPNGGVRMRRSTGGYRSTLLGGTVVQEQGERTGALPGRVISSIS